MNSKPHRQNSDFQLRYFLAGSCTTPDGAYILLYGQQVDMQTKLEHAKSQLKRREAKLKACEVKAERANLAIKEYSGSGILHVILQAEADLLEAEADRLEIEADIPTWEKNKEAAEQELATIQKLMLEIKPHCKYADNDILTMSELSQEEEWLGELKKRAENFLLTAGTIPHDHFDTMRMHPQFKSAIVPHITQLKNRIEVIGLRDMQTGQLVAPEASIEQLMLELENKPLLLTSEA